MIFFTSAMDQAVVLFGKAVVEPFYRRFSGKLRHMDVLVNFFRDVVQMLQWTLENDNGPVRRCFLEYQPCFAIWTDEELTDFIARPEAFAKCHTLYLGHDILPTGEQEELLKEREILVHIIPDYYYRELEG